MGRCAPPLPPARPWTLTSLPLSPPFLPPSLLLDTPSKHKGHPSRACMGASQNFSGASIPAVWARASLGVPVACRVQTWGWCSPWCS